MLRNCRASLSLAPRTGGTTNGKEHQGPQEGGQGRFEGNPDRWLEDEGRRQGVWMYVVGGPDRGALEQGPRDARERGRARQGQRPFDRPPVRSVVVAPSESNAPPA